MHASAFTHTAQCHLGALNNILLASSLKMFRTAQWQQVLDWQ